VLFTPSDHEVRPIYDLFRPHYFIRLLSLTVVQVNVLHESISNDDLMTLYHLMTLHNTDSISLLTDRNYGSVLFMDVVRCIDGRHIRPSRGSLYIRLQVFRQEMALLNESRQK
jgi:hypothetical protein